MTSLDRSDVVAAGLLAVVLAVGGVTTASHFETDRADERAIPFEAVGERVGFNYTAKTAVGGRIGGYGSGGVYVTDYNNDGRPDILAIGGVGFRTAQPKYLNRKPVLYRNNGCRFARVDAIPTGVVENRTVIAASFFDYDNDGWDDLLLLPLYGRAVFLENTGGEFEVREVGLAVNTTVPTGASIADYDGNGFADVLVYQTGDISDRLPAGYGDLNVSTDNGAANLLFFGNGSSFERASGAGIEGEHWTLAATSVDLTGTGRPDVHVANDFNHDVLYINEGDGEFTKAVLGSATNRNAMSSEVVDVNRDARPDLFVTNVYFDRSNLSGSIRTYAERSSRTKGNNLLVNRGDGRFVDRAAEYGVRRGGWGWAAAATDFDNDGDVDLVHATQRFGSEAINRSFPPGSITEYYRYPAVWERRDDGFDRLVAARHGLEPTDGRGIATLDWDRDGDQDLVVGVAEGPYRAYENRGADGNWLQVDLRSSGEQTVVGSRVRVLANGTWHTRWRTGRTDFLSQDSRILHFGLAGTRTVDAVVIDWPDGSTRRLTDVPANSRLVATPTGVQIRARDGRCPTT